MRYRLEMLISGEPSTMTRQHFAAVIGSAVLAASLLSATSYATPNIEEGGIERCMSAYNNGFYHSVALIVCRPLAEQGVSHAQNVLGEIYMYGEGVPKDFDEAAKWFRLAAEQHHRRAQFMLGVLYWSGDGVIQDFDKAVKWFRLADEV
jgi:TPR repeat protein